jgi:predicted RNA methylase
MVLDAGCGTGDNALHIAALGLRVLGVDVAETAVAIARETAAVRSIGADFMIADAGPRSALRAAEPARRWEQGPEDALDLSCRA